MRRNYSSWTPADVAKQLTDIGLGKYKNAIIAHDIYGEILPMIEEKHMKILGIDLIGHRIAFKRFIKGLAGSPLEKVSSQASIQSENSSKQKQIPASIAKKEVKKYQDYDDYTQKSDNFQSEDSYSNDWRKKSTVGRRQAQLPKEDTYNKTQSRDEPYGRTSAREVQSTRQTPNRNAYQNRYQLQEEEDEQDKYVPPPRKSTYESKRPTPAKRGYQLPQQDADEDSYQQRNQNYNRPTPNRRQTISTYNDDIDENDEEAVFGKKTSKPSARPAPAIGGGSRAAAKRFYDDEDEDYELPRANANRQGAQRLNQTRQFSQPAFSNRYNDDDNDDDEMISKPAPQPRRQPPPAPSSRQMPKNDSYSRPTSRYDAYSKNDYGNDDYGNDDDSDNGYDGYGGGYGGNDRGRGGLDSKNRGGFGDDGYGGGGFGAQGPPSPGPEDDGPVNLVACRFCGRKFGENRIQKHEEICMKASKKKKKVFDSSKMRLQNSEAAAFVGKNQPTKEVKKTINGKPKYQVEHEKLVAAMRAARQYQKYENDVAKGINAKPPPMPAFEEAEDDRQECPYCGRKFGEQQLQRHMNSCPRKNNPPPRRAGRR